MNGISVLWLILVVFGGGIGIAQQPAGHVELHSGGGCLAHSSSRSRDSRSPEKSERPVTHGFKADVPLSGLAPGTYVLRVEATSATGRASTHRDILFDVTGQRNSAVCPLKERPDFAYDFAFTTSTIRRLACERKR